MNLDKEVTVGFALNGRTVGVTAGIEVTAGLTLEDNTGVSLYLTCTCLVKARTIIILVKLYKSGYINIKKETA